MLGKKQQQFGICISYRWLGKTTPGQQGKSLRRKLLAPRPDLPNLYCECGKVGARVGTNTDFGGAG
eukprot:4785288-Pyramimonas_sp.AAC.1